MITKECKIINKLGLHARASSKLVMIANKFNSEIKISKDNKIANAKSLMSVMMLSATMSSIITLTAVGDDEKDAIVALESLINNKFGEEF